jgi:hypothetical protein
VPQGPEAGSSGAQLSSWTSTASLPLLTFKRHRPCPAPCTRAHSRPAPSPASAACAGLPLQPCCGRGQKGCCPGRGTAPSPIHHEVRRERAWVSLQLLWGALRPLEAGSPGSPTEAACSRALGAKETSKMYGLLRGGLSNEALAGSLVESR